MTAVRDSCPPPASGPKPRHESGEVVALAPASADVRALLAEVSDGRPAAVAALFDRFHPNVRRVLTRTLGSAHDVDDLVQDTFIVVFRRLHELREPEALTSFILGIAVRVAKNELRRRSFRRFVGLDDSDRWSSVAAHDPEARQEVRHVYAALDKLDADARLAFVLRFVEGLALDDVAQACRCSLATVKRRLARAQKKFDSIARCDPVLAGLLEPRADEEEAS